MARIRSIKPEFWASESLGTRLPGPDGRQARLLFIALWNHAEDHGVCRAAPALLRSVAFPYDEDVTTADVSRWLGMLEAARFIVRYERDGSSYLWVRAFDEHQKIDRKSKTSLPEPSNQEKQSGVPAFTAVPSPRRALVEPSLQEGKGREGKGEDTASQGAADAGQPPEDLPDATDDAEPITGGPDPRQVPMFAAAPVRSPPAKSPRSPSGGEALYQRIQTVRRDQCAELEDPFVEDRWDYARQNKLLEPIAKGPPEEKKRFEAAFQEYLSDDKHRQKGWPLSLFMTGTVRSTYEQRALQAQRELEASL